MKQHEVEIEVTLCVIARRNRGSSLRNLWKKILFHVCTFTFRYRTPDYWSIWESILYNMLNFLNNQRNLLILWTIGSSFKQNTKQILKQSINNSHGSGLGDILGSDWPQGKCLTSCAPYRIGQYYQNS